MTTLPLPRFEGAVCVEVDPEAYFPEPGDHALAARGICFTCPARRPCLEYALAHPVIGIWGGTTVRQRRKLAAQDGLRSYEPLKAERVRPPLPESVRKRELRAGASHISRQPPPPRVREVHRLRALGISLGLIAKQMGVSERTVARYLRIGLADEAEQVAS